MRLCTCRCLVVPLFFAFAALLATSQDVIVGQQPPPVSLGDVARETRRQRERNAATDAHARELARQLEDQKEEDTTAPAGYKYYRGKGRPFAVLVPESLALQARDEFGEWLSFGSDLTLIVGSAITVNAPNAREQLDKAARQYLGCEPDLWVTQVSGRAAGIMWIGEKCRRPQGLSGSIAFYSDGTDVYSLICAKTELPPAPIPSRGDFRSPLPRKSDPDSRAMCDGIFRAVRFGEQKPQWTPRTTKPAPATSSVQQSPAAHTSGESLGDLARKQRARQKAQAKLVLNDESEELNGNGSAISWQVGAEPPYLRVRATLPFETSETACCRETYMGKLPSGRSVTVLFKDRELRNCGGIDCVEEEFLRKLLPSAIGSSVNGRSISRSDETRADHQSRRLEFLISSSFGVRYGSALLFYRSEAPFVYACTYFDPDRAAGRDVCQSSVDSVRVTIPQEQQEFEAAEEDPPYDSEGQEE